MFLSSFYWKNEVLWRIINNIIWGGFIIWRLKFVSLGSLMLRRRTLGEWMKIQNNFTEARGIIPVCVGVTKIRIWSLAASCIFHDVRYAVAVLVIVRTLTKNFTSALSYQQCVCCNISCCSVFNCWLHRWAFHVFVHIFFWMMHQRWRLYWSS